MKYQIYRRIISNWLHITVVLILVWQWNFAYFQYARAYSQSQARGIAISDAHPEIVQEYLARVAQEKIRESQIKYRKIIPITAYSSTIDQTDDTPCITANGFNLCKNNQENVIAANFLPFGTKIRIPKHFGDQVFTVQDRMNARYYYRADIWMQSRNKARIFGIKYTEIEVLK